MTIKELKQHYAIYKRDSQYRICSLTEHGRSPHKYLCSAIKNGNKMSVVGYGLTSNLNVFKEQVKDYLSKLEYNSEYFNPDLRNGLKEELFVHDYMKELGFESYDNHYKYKSKNIYGGKSFNMDISFDGLEAIKFWNKELPETVDINFWIGSYSWINVKVPRTFQGLKKGIDGLLKPLLLVESLKAFELAEKLNDESIDLNINMLSTNLDFKSESFKAELKQRLLNLAEQL